ncbi:MAG: MurT ligase domain-containing protein [bacterium]|nr:MurT ligase domain-containing protein [bacterium]
MNKQFSILAGKIVQKIARIKGGGSALPGLFIEKTNPRFAQETLAKIPHGVVVISGTNGKTTTTKMVVELLESQGLRVFTNKTGSNFVRGVAAALLEAVDFQGNLAADIAVLELDEAHATHFVKIIQPRYTLLLNVMRDQLDRFGEIDYTAKLLQQVGESTSGVVLLNGSDSLLGAKDFTKNFQARVVRFGFNPKLAEFFPNDEELHASKKTKKVSKANSKSQKFEYRLEDFSKNSAQIQSQNLENFKLQISGIHNILNLTAAFGLVNEIFANENLKFKKRALREAIGQIQPAFGRGETLNFNGDKIEIMLVKNPAGFRSNLKSAELQGAQVMLAINDNYADGRDMSWLWDVDFSALADAQVAMISGVRAYDMALRLFHDDIDFDEQKIELNLRRATREFLAEKGDKKIFATYTAMLEIRKEISKITDVEKIL